MKLTALLLSATLFTSHCPTEGKWYYDLHEISKAPSNIPLIVDYNTDGIIDVQDAIFIGYDKNKDGNNEFVEIYKFRQFMEYKGKDRRIHFSISEHPDEFWADYDGDGLYDQKLYRNGALPSPILERLNNKPQIKTIFKYGIFNK